MVLLSAYGVPAGQIAALLDCHPATVRRWINRRWRAPSLADLGYEGARVGIKIPVNWLPAVTNSAWVTGPATPSRSLCASANGHSPCSPSTGAPSSTSPPSPSKITGIVRAVFVLTHHEQSYIK